jgi:dihydroorotate dehydrogenase (NAD+) catalytic subunit
MGGITNANDALEFIMAGATAVAVGTATFVTPTTILSVIAGIEKYLIDNEIASVTELIGCVTPR